MINIFLPPLRERAEDILPLVEHFIGLYGREINKPVKRVTDEARLILERYAWPGNVRELSNTVERIMILEDGELLLPGHLPPAMTGGTWIPGQPASPGASLPDPAAGDFNLRKLTEAFQAKTITAVLERTRGSRTEAAKLLGLSRVGLYHQMKKLGLLKKEEC